jgi:hypothetical protein
MALEIAITSLALAVGLIRLGWGGRKGLASAGWAMAALSLAGLTWSSGAWGLATGLTAGAVFALVLVLFAGATSPQRAAKRLVASPEVRMSGSYEGIARRAVVFLLVVPVSFIAAQWLAFAVNTMMKGAAPLNANSVSTMMFIQPVIWSILMAWQMVLKGPRQMLLPPALATVIGTLIWIAA